MITKNDRIRCDACGRFISYKDLAEGKATNTMVTPDSHVSQERYESVCKKCRRTLNFPGNNKPKNVAIDDYPY